MSKVVVPFLRSAYNYDRNLAGDESGLSCPEPSLAKQSFAEEVDINTIVRKFNVTGELPQGVRAPTYGDFSQVIDFQSAMNAVRAAEESFMEMPAETRARFNNEPARFVEFCSDPRNQDEAIRMGLAFDTRPQEPTSAPPATPVAAPPQVSPEGGKKPA